MKRFLLFAVLVSALPLMMMAQDDLYFIPKKSVKKVASTYEKIDDRPVYHSGSNRDVDEYNRHGKFGSYFQKIGTDSLGNDIIEFHSGKEDVSDTLAVYPGTKIQRGLSIFGGECKNLPHEKVLFYLSDSGRIIISSKAPDFVKRCFANTGATIQ